MASKKLTKKPKKPPMTFDFSKLEIRQQTTWVEMPEVCPGARVCVRPAAESNSLYYSNMLKRSASRARRMIRTDRITAEDTAQSRNEDRELFPRYVVCDWKNVVDTKGKPVPFTQEASEDFCKALPDWLFDRLRNTAATPERFVEDNSPEPDMETLSGNS